MTDPKFHQEFPMFSKRMRCGLRSTKKNNIKYAWGALKFITCKKCLRSIDSSAKDK